MNELTIVGKISFANTDITDDILSNIRNEEPIRYFGNEFNFQDDKWDFTSLKDDTGRNNTIILNFSRVNNKENKIIIKLFALNDMLNGGCYRASIYLDTCRSIDFMNFLSANNTKFDEINAYTLNSFFKKKDVKEITKSNYKSSIKKLVFFISTLFNHAFDDSVFYELDKRDNRLMSAENHAGKRKLLPFEFMNPFTNLLYSGVKNKDLNLKTRIVCGCLYIATQTGIRKGEMFLLEKGCSYDAKSYGSLIVHYLVYKSTKSLKGEGYETVTTVLNDKANEVFKILEEISTEKRFLENITENQFDEIFETIIQDNSKILNCISEDTDNRYDRHIELNDGRVLNLPDFRQFRVYYDSELKRRGFSSYAIAKLLNHHDEKMIDYYARSATEYPEEDLYYTKKVLKDVLTDELKLLGPNADPMTNRLNKFYENGIVKTANSIDRVIDEIQKEMPCRVLKWGMCIKPNSTRACSFETHADEINCAFGYCPNQYHFFFNLKYYYDKLNELFKAYKYNINAGYNQASEKEAYKISNLIKNKIEPELVELKKEIEAKGTLAIIQKYDYLDEIINNINVLEERITEWKKKH